jgi:hypothetical protein
MVIVRSPAAENEGARRHAGPGIEFRQVGNRAHAGAGGAAVPFPGGAAS